MDLPRVPRSTRAKQAFRHATRPIVEQLEHRQLLAAGDLDPTFGNGGIALTTSEGPGFNQLHDSVVLSDGKVIAVGITGDDFIVARYDTAGKLDPTFGNAGFVRTDFGHKESANAVTMQSDGKIVVAGEYAGVWPDRKIALARYNPNGSLDTTFGSGGKLLAPSGWYATDVAIATGGKIVVTGAEQRASNNDDPVELHVWRFNADGSLDTSFDGDGEAFASIGPRTTHDHLGERLAVQPDGKVLVVGRSWQGADGHRISVARFNVDGSLDSTLDGDGVLITDVTPYSTFPLAIAAAPGGKFVVATGWNGMLVARYNGDGSADTTFDNDGRFEWNEGPNFYVNFFGALAVQGDGKILLGVGHNRDVTIARINATGGFDAGFGVGGRTTVGFDAGSYLTEIPYSIGIHATDGSVVVGSTIGTFFGTSNGYADFTLIKLTSAGSHFLNYGGISALPAPMEDYGRDLVLQPDGKYIATGMRSRENGGYVWIAARHNPDGSLDPSFGNGGVASVEVNFGDGLTFGSARLQPDGKLVLVGGVNASPYGQTFAAARLNPDGSLDTTFAGDGTFVLDTSIGSEDAYDVLFQDDGKLVLIGHMLVPAQGAYALLRLNPNGTIDTSFGNGGRLVTPLLLQSPPRIAVRQPDGNVLIAGSNAIVRYKPDWTPDAAFDGDGLLARDGRTVADLALDAQGRIVLLEWTFDNGEFSYWLTRLNTNGTTDAAFGDAGTIALDPTSQVEGAYRLDIDAFGRILVVGNLSYRFDFTRLITMRFLPDGEIDPHFGTNGFVTALPRSNHPSALTGAGDVAVTPDGKVLVLGYAWNPANGTRDLALVRYAGSTPLAAHPGGTYEVIEGGSVTLTGSATSNLPVTKYEWDLNNDGTFETVGASATFSAAAIDGPAQRIIPLRVTDASGQTNVRHATINIQNARPAITLSGPPRADAGVPYPLTWTYSDPAVTAGLTEFIRWITIDWGDGDVQTIQGATPGTVTHTYSAARANYRVKLTLTDEDGSYVAEHSVSGPGILDSTFGGGDGIVAARGIGGKIFPLPDGTFIHAAGQSLSRYFADGTQDLRFGNRTLPAGLTGADHAITPEGKTLVVGTEFTSTGANARGRIFVARYTVAGGLDTSLGGDGIVHFDFTGAGFDLGTAIAALPDGKILVAGASASDPGYIPSSTGAVLIRLNADGTPDTSYDGDGMVTTNYNVVPRQMVVAPSGRIYLGYKTDTYAPFTISALKPDGSTDTSFGNNGFIQNSYGTESSFTLDSLGNLLITGWRWDGNRALTRFRPDGTRDSSFGDNGSVSVDVPKHWPPTYSDVAFDAAGGILLLGTAQEETDVVNYVNADLIVTRVLADGTLDLAYGDAGSIVLDVFGNHSNDTAHSFAVLPTGKLLVSASNNLAHLTHESTPVTPYILRLGDSRHLVSANNTGPSISVEDLTLSPAAPKEAETFALRGTITDPDLNDSHTVTIEWGYIIPQVTFPTVLHLPPGQLTFEATHSFPEDSPGGGGAYAWPVKITVTDGLLDASLRTTITVQNADPTANAGPDKSAKENDVVPLTGAGTDPSSHDGLGYHWKVTGPSLGIGGTELQFTTKDISFVPGQVGTYTATLTVTDPDGGSHSDSTTITVTDSVPQIRLSYDQTFDEGSIVQVSSWYNADIVSRNWTVTEAQGNVVHTATSGSISFTAPDEGEYTVKVDYADDEGSNASTTVVLNVTNVAPQLPSFDTPIAGKEGVPVKLTLNATDPGLNDTLTYLWEILDAQLNVVASSNTNTFEDTLDSGGYTARLSVMDNDGGVTTRQAPITIANVAPMLRLSGPASVPEGSPYTLNLSSSDPGDDTITSWTINWGDGTPVQTFNGNPSSVTHSYADGPNTYPIVATATDEDGTYTVRTLATTNRLDPAFDGDGIANTQMSGAHDRVTGLVVQPDGKIIAVGSAGNPIKTGIVRYNVNGSRDSSFFPAVTLANTFGDAAVTLLPDGTVAVAASSSGGGAIAVVRLSPTNGAILSRTEVGTGSLGQLQIHALPDGRFYVAGRGGGGYTVARMTAAGTIDAGFGVRQTVLPESNHQLDGIVVQEDGKVVLGGAAQLPNGYGTILVRHNPDGTLDTTYGGGDGIIALSPGFILNAMILLPDGRILAAETGRLARFNTDGSQDMTFGTNGYLHAGLIGDWAQALLRDGVGRYLLVTLDHEVVRLNSDLTPDHTFGPNGRIQLNPGGPYNQTNAAALTPGGDVVIGGAVGTANVDTNFWLARILGGQPPVAVTDVPPTISITGAPTVADGTPYTLNLAATDPGADTITSWIINWGDGTPVQAITGNPSSVTHTFADGPGSYRITASVIDEDGAHGSDTLDVFVTPATQPFVFGDTDLSLDQATIDENGTVNLSGAFADTRGVHDVTIDWGDGSAPSALTLARGVSTFALAHRYLDDPAGSDDRYVITAVVHNARESRRATKALTVRNAPPAVNLGPDRSAKEGDVVTVTAAGVSDAGTLDTLTYHWEVLTAPGGPTFPTGSGMTFSFTPPDAGFYGVRLTVSDDDSGVRSDTLTITAAEAPPTLTAHASAPSIVEGATLTLTLAASDAGAGDALTQWTIDWGDGSPLQVLPGDATSASHAYPDGPLIVPLIVRATDADGTYTARITGIEPAGGLDSTFGGSAAAGKLIVAVPGYTRSRGDGIVIQPDGMAIAVGSVQAGTTGINEDGLITRFKPDGTLDTSFGIAGRALLDLGTGQVNVRAVALDAAGKLVVGGSYYTGGTSSAAFLARYNSNGTPDTSFGPAGTGWLLHPTPHTSYVSALAVLSDASILVANGHSPTGTTGSSLAVSKFKPDGTLDTTFGNAGMASNKVGTNGDPTADMAVTPDGKIVLVGHANFNGPLHWAVARFNADGTPDNSFDGDGKLSAVWSGNFNVAEAVEVLPDGRIVVAGRYIVNDGSVATTHTVVARYNLDGSLDPTFGSAGRVVFPASAPAFNPTDMSVDSLGRILVTGYGAGMSLLRVTPDGQLDASFGDAASPGIATVTVTGTTLDEAWAQATDANGRIWIVGITAPLQSTSARSMTVARFLPGHFRVSNASPLVSIPGGTPGTAGVTIGINMPLLRAGSFTDPGDDTWTATVNYGDGSGVRPLTLKPDKTFDLHHAYTRAGRYTIAVNVTDSDGAVGSRSLPVLVRDATLGFGTQVADTFDVRLTPDGQYVEFFENAPPTGAPTFVLPVADATTISVPRNFGNDRLTIHSGTFNLAAVGFSGAGTLAAFELVLRNAAAVTLVGNNDLRALELNDASRLSLEPAARSLRTSKLTVNGPDAALDLADGALRVAHLEKPAEVTAALEAFVRSARNTGAAGRWSGGGITSSIAATNPLTGLSVRLDGPYDVAVKYGYNGDLNQDGRVNADDYFRIDQGFLAQHESPTNAQGDVNFDKRINADDYFLIDQAFLGQSAPAAASAPASAATTLAHASTSESPRARKRRAVRPSLFSDIPIPLHRT